MGYHVHGSLLTEEVSRALTMAVKSRRTRAKLIHHSDRGIQYCSSYYQLIHEIHGITCSMTDGYDSYQNASAERVNGILKNAFLLQIPRNPQEATKIVKESIHIYNHERPNLAQIGIGADPYGPDPSHTTRHAGPHRAVDAVEDVRGSGKATTHNLFRLTFNRKRSFIDALV